MSNATEGRRRDTYAARPLLCTEHARLITVSTDFACDAGNCENLCREQ